MCQNCNIYHLVKPFMQGALSRSLKKSFRRLCERSNLGFKEINNFEIATSQKTLLAMTFREFFSKLLGPLMFYNF